MAMRMKMDHILRFRADEVTFEACDDEYVAHVFLNGATGPEKHYLMISRHVTPGKESGVFLEYDDQTGVAQDGIARCQLRSDGLTLELQQKAADALGVSNVRRIVVDFDMAATSIPELRKALAAIFADRAIYQDRSQS